MDEAEFHRRRRMFVIKAGRLILAPADLSSWHRDWFTREGWDAEKVLATELRGFYLDDELYFYRGDEFSFRADDGLIVHAVLTEMKIKLKLSAETKIFLGSQHKQNKFLGKLSELI